MSDTFSVFKMKLSKLNKDFIITEYMEKQFIMYYHTLIEWNQVMNLTAITEFNEVVEKHFLDSIVLGQYFDLDQKLKVIDIGTGAGFPGIPLKIMFPNIEIVLVDSLNKRVKFLNEIISKLHLEKVYAVHGRAEDIARKNEFREKFDLCVSRAVANLTSLSEYCIPFIKIGGTFVSYKSSDIESEIEGAKNAVLLLGGKLQSVKKFQLPDTEYHRSLVFIEKQKLTSKKYPRKSGIPTRQPLE